MLEAIGVASLEALFEDVPAALRFPRLELPEPAKLVTIPFHTIGHLLTLEDKRSVLARIHAVVARHPGMGLRLYRTANGYRCLVTHRTYDPASQECRELLEALGSDPLYIRLCRGQHCFRARLTPKPWRCGAGSWGSGTPTSARRWSVSAEH